MEGNWIWIEKEESVCGQKRKYSRDRFVKAMKELKGGSGAAGRNVSVLASSINRTTVCVRLGVYQVLYYTNVTTSNLINCWSSCNTVVISALLETDVCGTDCVKSDRYQDPYGSPAGLWGMTQCLRISYKGIWHLQSLVYLIWFKGHSLFKGELVNVFGFGCFILIIEKREVHLSV